jgi:glycosyltransferase involved in cell wall biosynthesis
VAREKAARPPLYATVAVKGQGEQALPTEEREGQGGLARLKAGSAREGKPSLKFSKRSIVPNQPPRVSVIIPCYNQARFLPEAVASVVAQSSADWEILIVDDGSPDDTAAVAERLIAAYPERRITLLRQPNSGPGASRNTAIRRAQGLYILPLDADDTIAPTMLAETAAILDARPEVGFVYTDVRRFGEEATTLHTVPYSLDALRFDCLMMPETLFRRAAWAQTDGFNEAIAFRYEDWDFWLRLAHAGWQGYHLARPLVGYRRVATGSRLSAGRRNDLELRAQLVLNHAALYEPGFVTWARVVLSPAWSREGQLRSWPHWLLANAGYCVLIARHRPAMLPKALLRPLFWRISVRRQGRLRGILRCLRIAG